MLGELGHTGPRLVEHPPHEWIAENLEVKTYLNRSLKIVFNDKVAGKRHEFHHEGGIEEYLETKSICGYFAG